MKKKEEMIKDLLKEKEALSRKLKEAVKEKNVYKLKQENIYKVAKVMGQLCHDVIVQKNRSLGEVNVLRRELEVERTENTEPVTKGRRIWERMAEKMTLPPPSVAGNGHDDSTPVSSATEDYVEKK